MGPRAYLGTQLSPEEYYHTHSETYTNAHADAVAVLLRRFARHLSPTVLDLGCGTGLGTELLRSDRLYHFIGVDNSAPMVERYKERTRFHAVCANFWDDLPKASSAIATHSLHLCPPSRAWALRWKLQEAGVQVLVVTSPLKRAVEGLGMPSIATAVAWSGEDRKTVWGWVLQVT